jgi:hypothetical protein
LLDDNGGIVDPAWSIHRTNRIEGFFGVALGDSETQALAAVISREIDPVR